ncbi:MAG TPA: DUF5684 domain-containing protein [Chloroflexota bacterium]|nr:DUF5684 domain-containing protein [Chloroflexota bacterium]
MVVAMAGLVQQGSNGGSAVGSLVGILFAIIFIAAQWVIFTKAGRPGWAALIPIYNTLQTIWLVGRPWWWLLLLLVPILNIIIGIILLNDLSTSFGHGIGFTLGLIFLAPIFFLILAFGSSQYKGPAAA